MYGCGTASDEWQAAKEHNRRSETDARHGRGTVCDRQEVNANSEQGALGHQTTGAIALVPVADEAEYLPQGCQRYKVTDVSEDILVACYSGVESTLLAQIGVVVDQKDGSRQQDKPYSRKKASQGRNWLRVRSNNQDHDQFAQSPDPSLEAPRGKIGPKEANQGKRKEKRDRPAGFEQIPQEVTPWNENARSK
jgi:hypothetical protein